MSKTQDIINKNKDVLFVGHSTTGKPSALSEEDLAHLESLDPNLLESLIDTARLIYAVEKMNEEERNGWPEKYRRKSKCI